MSGDLQDLPFWIAIKQATGATIKDLDGNKVCRAATARDIKDTFWSYYKDVNDPTRVVPCDAAFETDKLNVKMGGQPHHLKAGADYLGYVLVRSPAVVAASDDVTGLLAAAKETTEAVAAGWSARADGVYSTDEVKNIDQQIDEAVAALLAFKAAVHAMAPTQKPKPKVKP